MVDEPHSIPQVMTGCFYNAPGHKLRLAILSEAQFVTVEGIKQTAHR